MQSRNSEIFERYEKKYMLDERQYEQLLMRLAEYIEPDQFAHSNICNIYYDTLDYRLIRDSIEKPVYKEKLRMRSYGVPDESDMVFLEIKKKYDGVVYKRRVPMKLSEAKNYMNENFWKGERPQIIREMDWMKAFYGELKPAIFLSYERNSYKAKENPELRFTFDEKILWRKEALELSKGNYGMEILPKGYHLMEVKIPGVMPLWLTKIFSEQKIQPTSFSKYGYVYENEIFEKKAELGGKKYA